MQRYTERPDQSNRNMPKLMMALGQLVRQLEDKPTPLIKLFSK